MKEIVTTYCGVDIIKSLGFYYPDVNTNVECTSIEEVKDWIENIWLYSQNNIFQLADNMNLCRNLVWNAFIFLEK
jgi:maltodextrin utilization protein YvdJ